jgi:hypothetical protein
MAAVGVGGRVRAGKRAGRVAHAAAATLSCAPATENRAAGLIARSPGIAILVSFNPAVCF